MSDLNSFFHANSIAVIGASESLNSFGTRYILALLDFGFDGSVYAVNHSGSEILGRKIYRSILDVPQEIDLACICVSARFVPDILRDCIKKKVKAAIVLSAGFREAGEEGLRIEDEIVEIARKGVRIIGPNCFGTYCPGGKITMIPGGGFPKNAGGTALIAQSGSLSETIASRSFGEGIRYSALASYGNACDVNEADFLEYFIEDEETKVFAAYLEGVRDGRRLFDIARANRGNKPLLIWKVGLSKKGGGAASSHTGSLAGGPEVWNAFFRQTGAMQIYSFEELLDTMVGFSCLAQGCGPRVALISGGGGGAVVGADACESAGMEMPDFSAETIARLREVLPSTGTSIKNPLDIGVPHAPVRLLRSVLEIIAESDEVDVIVIRRIFFSTMTARIFSGAASVSQEQEEELLNIPVEIARKFKTPMAIIVPEELTGREDIEIEDERRRVRDHFFMNDIPVYLSDQRAFAALSHLAEFSRAPFEGDQRPEEMPSKPASGGRSAFLEVARQSSGSILDELRCKRILKEYGIDVTEPLLAQSGEAAVAVAQQIGFPVVMKIVSPEITHKSDWGGVKIGLASQEDVLRAYGEIVATAKEKAPQAVIEGVSVQKMASSGLELVIGMTKDPQFGPVIMFGLGGTLVEIFKDIAFSIVPLTKRDARQMIKQIRAYRLLEGYRGQPAVDIERIEELLLKMSRMVEENPEMKEMDINPLIAYADGAVAVDARIILEDGVIKTLGE